MSARLAPYVLLALAAVSCGHRSESNGANGKPVAATAAPKPTLHSLVSVWGSSSNDVWAVGEGGAIVHWDGHAWASVISPTSKSLSAVAGRDANDVWAVGEDGVTLHYDGKAWRVAGDSEGLKLLGVWAGKDDRVWVAGIGTDAGVLRNYTGTKWENNALSVSTSLWRVWGFGNSSDIWLVGSDTKMNGLVIRGDGKTFDRVPFEGASLRALWGSGSDDVWAAAYSGETYHWNGSTWSGSDKIENARWLGMWGASSRDIWLVGFAGMIGHYDGAHWTSSHAPTDQILWSVWGSSPKDVWAVGNAGTVLHWDGQAWSASKR